MQNKADNLSMVGLIAAFGGQGIIEGFVPQIHDLVCFVPTTCQAETTIIAFFKLVTGIAGIVSGYYLIRKTSTPPGSNLSVIPKGQSPATVFTNGAPGMSYALVNEGGAGEVTTISEKGQQ